MTPRPFSVSVRIFLILLILPTSLLLRAQSADDLVQKAWNDLQNGNASSAEQTFKDVISRDSKNVRAKLGLSFLYSWQHRMNDGWDVFLAAMDNDEKPDALFYAMMVGAMAQSNADNRNFRIGKQYEYWMKHPDSNGIIQAMCTSRLADHERNSGEIDESDSHYAMLRTVDRWAFIGPFENISGSGFNKVYDPEVNVDLKASYPARYGTTAEWFVPSYPRPDKWVDIERHFPTGAGVFYAYTNVYSQVKRSVQLRIGTSGAFKVFLNDEKMLECEDEYNNDVDSYICETELQKGWNKVLVKMCAWDNSRNNFMLRFTDAKGQPLNDLKYSTDMQQYPTQPHAVVHVLPNPYEQYFEHRVAAHPDYPENYLLLADCYLRNDKGEQAEVVLRDALDKFPNCVVLLDRMMEAYIRNEKNDQIQTTLEKLWSVDSTDLSALDFRFREAIQNKNYSEAERFFEAYKKACPDKEDVLGKQLYLLANSGKESDALELMKKSYEDYPYSLALCTGMANINEQSLHDYDAAIKVWTTYLKEYYQYNALSAVATLYARKNDLEGWEKYREALRVASNDAPGFNYTTASAYLKMERYADAEKAIKRSLECCPSSSDYHELLGDIYTQSDRKSEGLAEYHKALHCYPGDINLREKLQNLEGKKLMLSNFSRVSIDSLRRVNKGAEQFPDDASVIVLYDNQYGIYPEGSYRQHFELLVRILKQSGIDDWKELNVGEGGVIEKAVTIKASGAEIRADVDKGQMVFKSLQEGDYVYLRYRDYSRQSDRFFKTFTLKHVFSGRSPIILARLQVLTPNDFKLNYRSVNCDIQPSITTCDDGKIYAWTVNDQPAQRPEASMPDADVIGKYVEMSSIDSWNFIADWYSDVTNRKSKVTYEIREKMKELVPHPEKLRQEEIVERVYEFVTDSIRYSYVPFRQSGGTPQKARDVLINRIGDCKDVATLGISMLSVVGIDADYCLVNTNTALMGDELPSSDFDHVIARVHLKSGMRYLDFTASNFPIGTLPSPDVDAFSLLIRRDTKEAQRLSHSLLDPAVNRTSGVATMNDDGDLHILRDEEYSGEAGAILRYAFRGKGAKESEKTILEDLASYFPNVKLTKLRFDHLDSLNYNVGVHEELNAPHYINDVGGYKLFHFPWMNRLNMQEEFSYEKREYPIEVKKRYDTLVSEFRLSLPPTLAPVELPADVTLNSPLGAYSVHYRFEKGELYAKRVFSYATNKVTVADYAVVKEFVNRIEKEDEKQILLGAPKSTPSTKKTTKKR